MTQPIELSKQTDIQRQAAAAAAEPRGSPADTEPSFKATAEPNVKAIANLIVALVAVSFAAIFIRYSTDDIGANATVFSRFAIFIVTFGTTRAIATFRQRQQAPEVSTDEPPTSRQEWILLVSVGAIATTSLVLWAMSLTRTSVANSVLLNNLTPLFTSLGGWLFLGQRFDRRFLLGLGIALGGALALGASDLHLGGETLRGDGLALLSAAFLATYFLLAERLRDRFSATTILLWRCSVGAVILVPLVIVTEGAQFFPTTPSGWLAAIALGIICEGLGQRLLASSFENFSSSFISLFLLLEPPLSALLAWAIFGEQMGLANWVSLGIVSIGLYIAQSSDTATATVVSGDSVVEDGNGQSYERIADSQRTGSPVPSRELDSVASR